MVDRHHFEKKTIKSP